MDEREGTAKSASRQCAPKAKLDNDAITACSAGKLGTELMQVAADAFNKQFPSRATVPHTFVNGDDTKPSFDTLKKAMCAAGSTASACSANATATRFCEV